MNQTKGTEMINRQQVNHYLNRTRKTIGHSGNKETENHRYVTTVFQNACFSFMSGSVI